MITIAQAMQWLGIALQYSFLLAVYYFLYRILRIVYLEYYQPVGSPVTASTLGRTPCLVVVEAGGMSLASEVFSVGDSLSIGRGEHNGIVITDHFVSHEHAAIVRYGQQYRLVDLGSTNKTRLNGTIVTGETGLQDGDIIEIGAVSLRFER